VASIATPPKLSLGPERYGDEADNKLFDKRAGFVAASS
jgi:hypothetical protein